MSEQFEGTEELAALEGLREGGTMGDQAALTADQIDLVYALANGKGPFPTSLFRVVCELVVERDAAIGQVRELTAENRRLREDLREIHREVSVQKLTGAHILAINQILSRSKVNLFAQEPPNAS